MRKYLYTLLLAMLVFGVQDLRAEGIEFYHEWDEALNEARSGEKYIFLDAYTTWCGPCKWMAATVMTQPKVAAFYNDNFVNLKLDMEKGEGLEIAKRYKVGAYPSLLFFDSEGGMAYRTVGALDADAFIALGQKILDGVESLQPLYDAIESGEYDRETLLKYIMHGQEAAMDIREETAEYQKGMKTADLHTEDGWKFFQAFVFDVEDDLFTYFADNRAKFEKDFGKADVEDKYYRSHLIGFDRAVRAQDSEKMKAYGEILDGNGSEEIQGLYHRLVINSIQKKQGKEIAYQTLTQWLQEGRYFDAMTLNSFAWGVYEAEEISPEYVDMAISWIEKSVELERTAFNVDTYAMLMYKGGNLERAIELAEEAIELGERDGMPTEETKAALAKMREEQK